MTELLQLNFMAQYFMDFTNLVISALSTLTLISDILIVFLVLYLGLRRLKPITPLEKLLDLLGEQGLYFAFIVALVATGGSLFFSEIANFTPCKLCWFQRIFMYPQALLGLVALLTQDRKVWKYLIPLSVIGGLISIYNYYIQLFPAAAATCGSDGLSCTQKLIWHYGYITIPVMALTASILIIVLTLLNHSRSQA